MSNLILPGLIDPHVHLREPGQTHKEDFYTGTCAALSGGFTTILDMPNNLAPITTAKRLNEKIKIAKEKIVCDVGFHFGSLGDNLDEFPKIINKVLGLKLYLNQTTGNFVIDKKILEKIFIAWNHAQTPALHSAGVKPILMHAEENVIGDVIRIARRTKTKIHVCHVCSKNELGKIIEAKEMGMEITCGVTPHHLFLTEKDIKRLGSFAKMKPPLGTKTDQDFLWKNLKFIDVVESDHAPHTIEEKNSINSPFGVPGLETTLPLLLTAVSQKRLNIEDVIRLCHTNPSRIFNIKTDPKTKIIIDLNSSFIIHNSSLFTKCTWSPFNGWKVKGKVQKVFIRGKKVFENGKILVKPGFGKILTPHRQ